MDDAKQRVKEELEQLSERTSKLVKFTLSERFGELDDRMQYLMRDQVKVMLEYGDILRRRLMCWDNKDRECDCLVNSDCNCSVNSKKIF